MLPKSYIANTCYCSNPLGIGNCNYDLKSNITFFVLWSSYMQLIGSFIMFQPKENKGQIQSFQDSMFHPYSGTI